MNDHLPVPASPRALGAPTHDPAAGAAAPQRPSHRRAPRLERVTCLDHAAGLLAAGGGRVCCTWPLRAGEPDCRIVMDAPIQTVSLARNATVLALGAGAVVAVFELPGGRCRFDFIHDAEVTSVHIGALGTLLASADVTGRVLLHDLRTGRRLHDLKHPPGRPLVFVHRGRFMLVESHTHTMLVDTGSGEPLRRFAYDADETGPPGGPLMESTLVAPNGSTLRWFDCSGRAGAYRTHEFASPIRNIDIHEPRGLVLAATAHSGLYLFDLGSGEPVARHESFTTPVTCAKFDSDAGLLVAGGEALVQHIVDGRHVRSFYDQARPLVAMAMNAARRELLVSDRDGGIARVELDSGRVSRPFVGHTGSVSAVLGSEGWTASGAYDGTLRIWPNGPGATSVVDLGEGPVQAIAAAPDGRIVWAGTWDGRVSAVDSATGERIASIDCGSSSIRTLAFDAQFRRLAAGGNDGELRILDAHDGGRILLRRRQPGCAYLARWDADGNLLVADRRGVRVYRGDDLTPTRLCASGGDEVRWFELCGNRLVLLSLDGALGVHDAASFSLLAQRRLEPSGHHRSVVVLGPDRIATASADGLVRVFDARLEPVATLEVLRDGFLWGTPPRGLQPGWLHTDRAELLEVGEGAADAWRPWARDDPRRARYLATRISPSHVMLAVNAQATPGTAALQALPDSRGFAPATHRLGLSG